MQVKFIICFDHCLFKLHSFKEGNDRTQEQFSFSLVPTSFPSLIYRQTLNGEKEREGENVSKQY